MADISGTSRPAYAWDAETSTWYPIGVGAHTHPVQVWPNRGTTAERPASPAVGDLYYDTTLGQLVAYGPAGIWAIAGTSGANSTSGGTLYTDGTYNYRVFTTTGSLTVYGTVVADILQVAGGGGGGAWTGGGGGAGGVNAFASQTLTTGSYLCTVGAGGAGGAPGTNPSCGTVGTDSYFVGLSHAIGGGNGQGYPNNTATLTTGGSGGGGTTSGGTSANPGAGTSGQGYSGGTGQGGGGGRYSGGGGGGAGGVGVTATSSINGDGGPGTNSVTNWGSLSALIAASSLGVAGYIAGGGGGGVYNTTQTAGGSGGGGAGGAAVATPTSNGANGTLSTGGGGGGGGSDSSTGGNGGNGASGFVVVRYAV